MLVLMLLAIAFAGYAYYIDSKRPEDDPEKRNYPLLAILLAPVTFPALLIFAISIFILRVLTYTIFLVLFVIALLVIREPVIASGLQKTATSIGDKLLKANTFLIRLFLRPWTNESENI
jgi:hypothetical protein